MEVILLLKAKLNELIKNIEKLHERDQELSDEINRMQLVFLIFIVSYSV